MTVARASATLTSQRDNCPAKATRRTRPAPARIRRITPQEERMRVRATLSLLFATFACGLVATADEDPVRDKLATARTEHKQAVENARKGVLTVLKTKAADAQSKGLLDLLEKYQAETKEFTEKGTLPKSVPGVPTEAYKSAVKKANDEMVKGYVEAVHQYTKDGKIPQAKAVRDELEEFKRSGRVAPDLKSEVVPPDPSWVPLFNGKDTSGWKQFGNPKHTWTVSGGVLTGTSAKGNASVLMTAKADYADFHVRLETKQADGLHSAIGIRLTEKNNTMAGYYAAVSGSANNSPYATGDIYYSPEFTKGEQKTLHQVKPAVALPADKWHMQEVIVRGNQMTVILNDKVIAKTTDPNMALAKGAVGILCRGNSVVHVRKVEIKELPVAGRQ